MKTIERLSKKAIDYCDLSGFDSDKVREAIKSGAISIEKFETKKEMDEEGIDYSYPYVVNNPYNIDIT